MKYTINIDAGGIFSKYMTGIQNAYYLKEIDRLYFNSVDRRLKENMFNYIFKQKEYGYPFSINCKNFPAYSRENPIELSNKLIEYKNLAKVLKLRTTVQDKINHFVSKFNINNNSIGVHIRLCDMNQRHCKEYGIVHFEDFVKHMNINQHYFVSSDNEESLIKLKSMFNNNISYIPNLIRGDTEISDTFDLQIKNFSNPMFWEEAFIEMFLLSKCSGLICRTSNLANAAIINSNSIKKVISITPTINQL
jgi:hypothetical protein